MSICTRGVKLNHICEAKKEKIGIKKMRKKFKLPSQQKLSSFIQIQLLFRFRIQFLLFSFCGNNNNNILLLLYITTPDNFYLNLRVKKNYEDDENNPSYHKDTLAYTHVIMKKLQIQQKQQH